MAILLTLVVQNSAQALFMRYSFKPKDQVRCRRSIMVLPEAGWRRRYPSGWSG